MGYRLSSCPTFSYFSYFLGLFLLFPFFSQKTLTSTLFFAIKCLNYFSYQEKLGMQESAPCTLQPH